MLRFLHIRHFALAEDLAIDFHPGLNILTGETGAGKSVLVNAIAAVLGERVYSEVVRTGFDKAEVRAAVDISAMPDLKQMLLERGIEAGDELLLRREIAVKGNSRAFINDVPVTISTLAEVGNFLVDIHGQHEHQSLLRKETHRGLLDAYGRHQAALEAVAQQYAALREARQALHDLQARQAQLDSQYDLYEFQFREIDQAALEPGEEERLEQERKLLANMEKLFEISGQLSEIFNSGDINLLNLTGQAAHHLDELARYAADLENISREFASAKIVMEEAARSVEEFQNRLEFDPERLNQVETRLNQISLLKKKYGGSVEAVLARHAELKHNLELRDNFDFEIAKLTRVFREAAERYGAAALQLSALRRETALRMEKVVQEQLSELGMPRTRFQARLERTEAPDGIFEEAGRRFAGDEAGIDRVEFFISPNPGEDFKPLNKIASGGEISRIMLALKSLLAEIDRIPTLIFDEIDSGVSGRIARAVGRSIQHLSGSHQILCITHLPQIASFGETHFTVEKYTENGRTFTRILPLEEERRVEEIARLMGGEKISETVLQSARQLLAEGRE